MSGIKDLDVLLKSMQPSLHEGEFVFCTLPENMHSLSDISPIMSFREKESVTAILGKSIAKENSLQFEAVWKLITLNVHSDLAAVGFLAKITGELAKEGISVNAVSAYYHDHLFVPVHDAGKAMEILQGLSKSGSNKPEENSMIIASACLAGISCRYDGKSKPDDKIVNLAKAGMAILVCPEQLGGLPTPRMPCEIVGDSVLRKDGADMTKHYVQGANEALNIAKLAGCKTAVLKSKSPMCGCGKVYDGTFTKTPVSGDGVFTKLLKQNKIQVYNEEEYCQ